MATLSLLSRRVYRELKRSGLTLATAESCTGGWIAKLFTDFSGSSKYFRGGWVAYANDMKGIQLGIKVKNTKAAVRRTVALRMARQALVRSKSDLAVATTGYMEPTPDNADAFRRKRITGICFLGIARQRNATIQTYCERIILRGTRRQNRVSTSIAVLRLIELNLRGNPSHVTGR